MVLIWLLIWGALCVQHRDRWGNNRFAMPIHVLCYATVFLFFFLKKKTDSSLIFRKMCWFFVVFRDAGTSQTSGSTFFETPNPTNHPLRTTVFTLLQGLRAPPFCTREHNCLLLVIVNRCAPPSPVVRNLPKKKNLDICREHPHCMYLLNKKS